MPSFKQVFPKVRVSAAALAVSGILTSATVFAQNTYTEAPVAVRATDHPQDAVFAQLRDASRNNNAALAAQLADQLSGYPLTSYVEYYRIKPRMFNSDGTPNTSAPDGEIQRFINTYQNDALGDRMRNDYALVLGARGDWRNFRNIYAQFNLKDDVQLKCYEQMANAADGQNVTKATMAILSESKYANTKACQQLLRNLASSGKLSNEDINYFTALSAYGSGAQGQALAAYSKSAGAGQMARLVSAANSSPAGLAGSLPSDGTQTSALAQAYFGYSEARRATAEAASYYRNAYQQYSALALPDDVLGWQARAGMRAGDWQLVSSAIDKMTDAERNSSTWQYWRGRAAAAQGNRSQANGYYQNAAQSFDFYGILAKEELGLPVTIPAESAPLTTQEVNAVARTAGFERARKFQAMNMTLEYNREWNYPLRGMSDRQLLAAAEYAHRLGMLDRMINTSERTKNEFNFKQRYPTPYLSTVKRYSSNAGIIPAWAYGITRQESRFVMSARSGANANGLMQIIPETARTVARKLGLNGFTTDQLYNTDTNIQIGTAYLGQTLNLLGGSMPLASAGYNAGPGRPPQWRRTLTRSVDGAIYAETIPFSETRSYVKNVMANTVYYNLMMDGHTPSLKSLMGTVSP